MVAHDDCYVRSTTTCKIELVAAAGFGSSSSQCICEPGFGLLAFHVKFIIIIIIVLPGWLTRSLGDPFSAEQFKIVGK